MADRWVFEKPAVNLAGLLLEELIEGVARVAGIARRRRIQSRCPRATRDLRRGGFARHGNPRREQRALVLLILNRNAHRYRLHALKARRRFEMGALLATVQLSPALRTRSIEHGAWEQRRRAVVTA